MVFSVSFLFGSLYHSQLIYCILQGSRSNGLACIILLSILGSASLRELHRACFMPGFKLSRWCQIEDASNAGS